MDIKIPFKTPSVNHLYGHHGFRQYLKPEAKELRQRITEIIISTGLNIHSLENKRLKVCVSIYEDWTCKNGSIKRTDIANREKFLIDSVFNALGLDDKYIFEHTMIKVQSNEDYARVSISCL